MSSTAVLTTLLKRAPGDKGASLYPFLPDSTKLEVQSEREHSHPLSDQTLQHLIANLDDSWYIEKFKSMPAKDLNFYLSLFPEKKRESLSKKLGIETDFYELPNELIIHSLNILFKELFPNELPLPLSFLPDSPLSYLLGSPPQKLHKLAFYLGLFDVSMELKSVLKGSILKSIQETLFPDEIEFCRSIAEFRHVVSFGQIGLSQWNEDHDVLRKVIFERGLYRLSIGLSDSSPDFIWYVLHSMNKESGEKIQKLPKTAIDHKLMIIILEQIETAWKGVQCTVLN